MIFDGPLLSFLGRKAAAFNKLLQDLDPDARRHGWVGHFQVSHRDLALACGTLLASNRALKNRRGFLGAAGFEAFLSSRLVVVRNILNGSTARFNRDSSRVGLAEKVETHCSLRDWFERAPDIEFQEDIVGLGHYGKTLTVLFTEEALRDEDENEDEEDDDAASGMPSSRWRRNDRERD